MTILRHQYIEKIGGRHGRTARCEVCGKVITLSNVTERDMNEACNKRRVRSAASGGGATPNPARARWASWLWS